MDVVAKELCTNSEWVIYHQNSWTSVLFPKEKLSPAGQCLALHASLLRGVGFLRWRGKNTFINRAHHIYRTFILTLAVTYILQEIVYAFIQRNDMEKLSRVMFLLLCHITSVAKQLAFYMDANRIDDLLLRLDDPLFNGERGTEELARTAADARKVVRGYAGCAVVTCLMWLVFPVLSRLAGDVVEFSLWTGFDTHPPIMFTLTVLYTFYVITEVAIANTTMDAFMSAILYMCKTQLVILRKDLQTLPDRASAESGRNSECYDTVLKRSFITCYMHYQKVFDTSETFLNIFGMAIFIQFGVGGGILCMAAYKLSSLNVMTLEFASMVLFLACILFELFLYCYYGNELKVESELVRTAAYSMRWVGASPEFRQLLLMLLIRVSRPLRSTAGLLPLSLETYVKILKSSYTCFAVLRQTK